MFHVLRSARQITQALFDETAGSFYHVVVIALSAGIALLLPSGAKHFLAFWSRIEQDKISLIIIEMIVAFLLIGCFSYVRRSLRDRALAKVADGAGLISFLPRHEHRPHRNGHRF